VVISSHVKAHFQNGEAPEAGCEIEEKEACGHEPSVSLADAPASACVKCEDEFTQRSRELHESKMNREIGLTPPFASIAGPL
jgi:hypothetical protein